MHRLSSPRFRISSLLNSPQAWMVVASIALAFSCSTVDSLRAQDPLEKLTKAEIRRLNLRGDRLVDQGDYAEALKLYNQAYMGIVADIRGYDFRSPVTPSMFNREELGQEMLQQMEKEYTEEDLRFLDASYYALGLMPPSQDAKSLMVKMFTEEVAGFYDPDNKRMVLIVEDAPKEKPNWLGRLLGADEGFDKDEQKTTLAHELTHALQDQLYDLNAMEEGIEEDDDMLIAFAALVEGDATLLMFLESGEMSLEEMDPDAMRSTFNFISWMMPFAGGETMREAPPIFRDSLAFPYFQGMLFNLAVAGREDKLSKSGWPAIHGAYSKPPLSTEQIMHPSKYTDPDQYDAPQFVKLPNLEASASGWKSLGSNCLGEFQTSIMLKGVSKASRAAEGWDGDCYEIYEDQDGKLALAFVSIWDSPEDAEEFSQAYRAFRKKDPQATRSVFRKDAQQLIEIDRDKVYVLEGFSESIAKQALEQLKEGTEFGEKEFPLPEVKSKPGE